MTVRLIWLEESLILRAIMFFLILLFTPMYLVGRGHSRWLVAPAFLTWVVLLAWGMQELVYPVSLDAAFSGALLVLSWAGSAVISFVEGPSWLKEGGE